MVLVVVLAPVVSVESSGRRLRFQDAVVLDPREFRCGVEPRHQGYTSHKSKHKPHVMLMIRGRRITRGSLPRQRMDPKIR